MTASELRDLLAKILAGAAGGTEAKWRRIIGDVIVYPLSTHPACNWEVMPRGKAAEVAAVQNAVNVVREHHRWVDT